MNPFKDIVIEDRFRDNHDSPYYSCYEFVFNQVTPFYNSGLVLRLKNDQEAVEKAISFYQKLPEKLTMLIRLLRNKKGREKHDFLGKDEYFFQFSMVLDKIYIAVENIYFAVEALVDIIEDCHFFMYSSDGDTRWIDEYKIADGQLIFNRDISDEDDYTWYLDYYISRVRQQPELMHFVLYHIYDILYYRISEYKYTMELLSNMEWVQISDMHDNEKKYFAAFYSLDSQCTDWYSLNEKYKLDRII